MPAVMFVANAENTDHTETVVDSRSKPLFGVWLRRLMQRLTRRFTDGVLATSTALASLLLRNRRIADCLTGPSPMVNALQGDAAYPDAQATLDSIGDAVISTDLQGKVTYLNATAMRLTGWTRAQAIGHAFEEVALITDTDTGSVVSNPMLAAIRQNSVIRLTGHCEITQCNGTVIAIQDSTAPIHDRNGLTTGAVMVFQDVSAARAASQQMSYRAQHDALTGLPNRSLLKDRLMQAVTLAQRDQQLLAVLFLDVDGFKTINDTLGHDIGDRLLQAIAQRLQSCIRHSDTVSRLGGDEFVILLPELTHTADADLAAHSLLHACSTPFAIDDHNLQLGVSIGVVTYPDDGLDAATLLMNADAAMYHAKNIGRNNYQQFRATVNRHLSRTKPATSNSG
jgi:diguanylate cyclase (GGDEF)-like protein/PAS domain S-box-containing protein